MECRRLQKLLRNWYLQVQNEAMAPARMAAFMDNHLLECETCLADPVVRDEVERIKAMILPAAKPAKPAADEEGPDEEEPEESEDGDDDDEPDETDDDDDDEI